MVRSCREFAILRKQQRVPHTTSVCALYWIRWNYSKCNLTRKCTLLLSMCSPCPYSKRSATFTVKSPYATAYVTRHALRKPRLLSQRRPLAPSRATGLHTDLNAQRGTSRPTASLDFCSHGRRIVRCHAARCAVEKACRSNYVEMLTNPMNSRQAGREREASNTHAICREATHYIRLPALQEPLANRHA